MAFDIYDENPDWFEDIEPEDEYIDTTYQEITADEMTNNDSPEVNEASIPVDINDIPDLPDMTGSPSKMCKVKEILYETAKAWRLTIEYNGNDVTDWFPKSKCTYNQRIDIITIPLWLIGKKNWD